MCPTQRTQRETIAYFRDASDAGDARKVGYASKYATNVRDATGGSDASDAAGKMQG